MMYQLVCVVPYIYLEYAYVAINTTTTTTTTTTTSATMHTTTTSQLAKSTDWYASYQVGLVVYYSYTVPIILLLLYIMNIMHNITLALVFEYNIIYYTSQYYYYQARRVVEV